jgi:acetyl-CoA acetyltransferase
MNEAWILDVVRTPRGKGRPDGALHGIHPQALLAQCLKALRERVGFAPAEVDDVVAGNGILAGDHGDDIARLSLLLAGWPESVPGMTLNRFCGSGQQAITVAAAGVVSGAATTRSASTATRVSITSTTCTMPATPRASSTVLPRPSSPPNRGRGRTASPRGHGFALRQRSAPNRSSC